MSYKARLEEYERQKRKLQNMNLSYKEYEQRIRELAERLRV